MQHDIQAIPIRVVVAMDKFRGSLTAVEASEAVRDGLLQAEEIGLAGSGQEKERNFRPQRRKIEVNIFPMADGGEGSLDVVECAVKNAFSLGKEETGTKKESEYGDAVCRVEIDSVNHLGIAMKVPVLLFGHKPRTAFIEMAAVCGLNLIPKDYRNIMRSTSFGLGDVMQKVIESYGVRKLIVAIGGSGTSDGGFGMVSALGFRFVNPTPMRNKDVPSFISGITEVDDRGVESICPHLHETTIQVACDVSNPLLGPNGAVAVYSGQKGCKPSDRPVLEAAMENWAEVVGRWYLQKSLALAQSPREIEEIRGLYPEKNILKCSTDACGVGGLENLSAKSSGNRENKGTLPQGMQKGKFYWRNLSDFPGSGAAGGVGFAMKYMLGAELRPGWELFSEMIDLEKNIANADLVITGEGCFDESSLFGKLPYGISTLCRKHNKPLWVIAGRNKVEKQQWGALGIKRVEELAAHVQNDEDSILDARAILSRICREEVSGNLEENANFCG